MMVGAEPLAARTAGEAPPIGGLESYLNHRYVELNGPEKFTHFTPHFFVLFPLAGGILPILGVSVGTALAIAIFLGVLVEVSAYWWLRRILRYRPIHTLQSAKANYRAVLSLSKALGWTLKFGRPSEFIQATVPGFLSEDASGEQVSVLLLDSDVYVNSIFDPNGRPLTYSLGRNAKNVRAVVQAEYSPNPSFNSDPTGTGSFRI
jgi:hypothetical protein